MIRFGNRQRRRWLISPRWVWLLRALGFRRDELRGGFGRDAFVLRGVGNRIGPVLIVPRDVAQIRATGGARPDPEESAVPGDSGE